MGANGVRIGRDSFSSLDDDGLFVKANFSLRVVHIFFAFLPAPIRDSLVPAWEA